MEYASERVRRTVDESRIEIAPLAGPANNPSAVSPTDAPAFEPLQRTIRRIYPDALVTSYLVVAPTDSRYYQELTQNIYGILAARVTDGDRQRVHGTGERIVIRDDIDGVRFYRQFILNSTQ
ncbi:hypothetical protein BH23GEM7_BH23GEM7_14040 [soil metagenome]